MRIGEIIYSLITLLIMFLLILSPLIRKLVKSVDKSKSTPPPSEDNLYDSVDSQRVVQRILSDNTEPSGKIEFTEPVPIRHKEEDRYRMEASSFERLDKISVLKRAVIWREILSKPVALRDLGRDGFF